MNMAQHGCTALRSKQTSVWPEFVRRAFSTKHRDTWIQFLQVLARFRKHCPLQPPRTGGLPLNSIWRIANSEEPTVGKGKRAEDVSDRLGGRHKETNSRSSISDLALGLGCSPGHHGIFSPISAAEKGSRIEEYAKKTHNAIHSR